MKDQFSINFERIVDNLNCYDLGVAEFQVVLEMIAEKDTTVKDYLLKCRGFQLPQERLLALMILHCKKVISIEKDSTKTLMDSACNIHPNMLVPVKFNKPKRRKSKCR